MAKDTASVQPDSARNAAADVTVNQSDTANIANAVTAAVFAAIATTVSELLADDISSAVQSAVADCVARRRAG